MPQKDIAPTRVPTPRHEDMRTSIPGEEPRDFVAMD
jgi:hypothetical protein